MVNIGQTAYLVTSGEAVFVLDVQPKTDAQKEVLGIPEALSGTIATVRRPVMGQNGVTHLLETYYVEELETEDDRQGRELENRKKFNERIRALQAEEEKEFAATTKDDSNLLN
jgi:hypothetical protein